MMTFVSFGGRSYRLHMWVGDDFRNPGALLDKQLDPLTRAGHSCTGTRSGHHPYVDGI